MKQQPKTLQFLARRSPNHAVIVHVSYTDTGIKLLRITPDVGAMPDISDVQGNEYATRKEIRELIKMRLRMIAATQDDDTHADRQMQYALRKNAAGLVRIAEWIPKGRAHELRAIAKQMRDDLEE